MVCFCKAQNLFHKWVGLLKSQSSSFPEHQQYQAAVTNCRNLATTIQNRIVEINLPPEEQTENDKSLTELELLLNEDVQGLQDVLEKANHSLGAAVNLNDRVAANTAQQVCSTDM